MTFTSGQKPGAATAFRYSAPVLGAGYLFSGVYVVIPVLYSKHFGLSLELIAAVMLASRIFDTVTDPVIGYWSDRHFARTGTRKPFIAWGAILWFISAYFLFAPPFGVSGAYFLLCFFAMFLGHTIFEIPHLSWVASLAPASDEKSRILSMRAFAYAGGAFLFFLTPYLPFFATSQITPQSAEISMIAGGVVFLSSLFWSLKRVPDGVKPSKSGLSDASISLILKETFQNKPLFMTLGVNVFFGIANGIWFASLYFYVDDYHGFERLAALTFALGSLITVLSCPAWHPVIVAFGKRKSLLAALALFLTSLAGLAVLDASGSNFLVIISIVALVYVASAGFAVIIPALIAEASEYGEWKFGSKRTATNFSLYLFAAKLTAALSASLGLAFLGSAGFDPAIETHTDAALFAVKSAVSWIPALFILPAFWIAWKLPLSESRVFEIRRLLDEREIE